MAWILWEQGKHSSGHGLPAPSFPNPCTWPAETQATDSNLSQAEPRLLSDNCILMGNVIEI